MELADEPLPDPVPVSFLLPGEQDLGALRELDPESAWREFVSGERAWILQSWHRLRRAGLEARLREDLEHLEAAPGAHPGILVFHAKQKRRLRKLLRRREGPAPLLVGVRGDLHPAYLADLEIVQNRYSADGRRTHFLPHWPQAALKPRDPGRGTQIRCVAYKGYTQNLHPGFRDASWRAALQRDGVRWIADLHSDPGRTGDAKLAWNDYGRVDVVLAVRPPSRRLYPQKPATKLVNAWRAGVPALLGPERAFRELRTSELDYLEVDSPASAREAIRRLRREPSLYQAMVEHGRTRAEEFSFPAVLDEWRHLLYEQLPQRFDATAVHRLHRMPIWLRVLLRRCAWALARTTA